MLNKCWDLLWDTVSMRGSNSRKGQVSSSRLTKQVFHHALGWLVLISDYLSLFFGLTKYSAPTGSRQIASYES